MKTRLAALALCLLTLIFCVTPVIVAEARRNQPITIETELTEGELVEDVVLSKGYLHFKTRDEALDEFTRNHYEASKQLLEIWNELDETVYLSSRYPRTREEMEWVLNLNPRSWKLPETLRGRYTIDFQIPKVCTDVDGRLWALNDHVFEYAFYFRNESEIRITVMEANDVLGNIRHFVDDGRDVGRIVNPNEPGGMRRLDMSDLNSYQYGDKDSQIDGIPISVLRAGPTAFEAAFVLGNARYYVKVRRVTQQEFIELLISIVEAPHPETRNVIEYILEG